MGRVFVVVDSNRGSAWEWEFWWWVWVVGGIAGENLMTVVCDGVLKRGLCKTLWLIAISVVARKLCKREADLRC